MKLTLKHLEVRNFKGMLKRDFTLDAYTTIAGDNGTGKTTFEDAHAWLLTGKEGGDREKFTIKPTDANNEPIHRLATSVTGTYVTDEGRELVLRREYREKWVKKRGTAEEVLEGHEQKFFINDVPKSKTEYDARIMDMFPGDTLKLITNPHYFNSLPWQRRRDILFELGGDISDAEVAGDNKEFHHLLHEIQGKSLEEYKKEIASKKKKIKDELVLIPARIEEVTKAMPPSRNYEDLRWQLKAQEEGLADIEARILDESKQLKAWADGRTALQRELYAAEAKVSMIEQEQKNAIRQQEQDRTAEVDAKRMKLKSLASLKYSLEQEYAANAQRHEALQNNRQELIEKWEQVSAETLKVPPSTFVCPTCQQDLPEADAMDQKKKLQENFNRDKEKRINDINARGRSIKDQINTILARQVELRKQIDDLSREYIAIETDVKEFDIANQDRPSQETMLKVRLSASADYKSACDARDAIKAKIEETTEYKPDPDLAEKKRAISTDISALRATLLDEARSEQLKNRIQQLQTQEATQAQELARLEGIEFTILEFTKQKVSMIEDSINSRFNTVRFKMFQTNLNGGEEPCCETLIDGIPWADANNAGRINGGLDIIHAISEHYGVSAPIIIDNAESVNRLLIWDAQVIRLVVSNDKDLTVFDATGARVEDKVMA